MTLAIGVGLLLLSAAAVLTWHDANAVIVNILAGLGGFLIGAAALISPSLAGFHHWAETRTIGPVNVAFTLAAWCVLIGFYEAFKRGNDSGHYIFTPLTVCAAALLLPLVNFGKVGIINVGIVLVGLAVIWVWKTRGANRKAPAICAAVGGALLAGVIANYFGVGLLQSYGIGGISLAAFIALITGLMLWRQVFHREQNKYHHIWSTLIAGVFGFSIVVAGGAAAARFLDQTASRTVTTVSKVGSHNGDDNPLAPAAKRIAYDLSHHKG